MYSVVNEEHGTGKNARLPGSFEIRGKTGTAENPHGEAHSWFGGYITMEDHQMMSVIIVVENGGKGSVTAAPIAKEMFRRFSEIQNENMADAE